MPKLSRDEDAKESLLEELERGLRISRDDLDGALIEQPDIFHRVSTELALAISVRDAAKLERDQVQAELDMELREKFARAETKITEVALSRELETMPRMVTLRKDLGRLSALVDRWSALKESYNQRGYALKELVNLYVVGYFTTSSGGAARSHAVEGKAEDIRRRAGEQRQERVRSTREFTR